MQMNGQGAMPYPLEMVTSSWYEFARVEEALGEFFHPTDGIGSADTDDRGGQCWRELHSTGRRGVVWINGSSNCPKEAAGPPICWGLRGCGGGPDTHSAKEHVALQQEELSGMEGGAALGMAFILQWGRGWPAQVEGQCPGGLLPAGGWERLRVWRPAAGSRHTEQLLQGGWDHGWGAPGIILLFSSSASPGPPNSHPRLPLWGQGV